MTGLRDLGRAAVSSAGLRVRRWDAVVLGSGLVGLVAATRLGMAGHRVLLVEEEAARALPDAIREPFFLAGANDGGALDQTLRALALPLIDRRRLVAEPLAFQLIGPDLRMDVGEPGLTAEELVAWGRAKPEAAQSLVRDLLDAGDAERRALLEAPLVRVGRRLGLARSSAGADAAPPAHLDLASPLAELLDAQADALHHLPAGRAHARARARLLASPLAGGADFDGRPPRLHGLLRRRAESVYVEFRAVSGAFELAEVQGDPAVLVEPSNELWIGRTLVVAAPRSGLDEVLEGGAPELLGPPPASRRRAVAHFRAPRSVLPEGMASRLVLTPAREGEPVATLSVLPVPDDARGVDVVVRGLPREGESPEAARARFEARLRELAPLAGDALAERPVRRPAWDDEDRLDEPPPEGAWPRELEIRLPGRPPMYLLERAAVAHLGLEGDLLLGWRGGDAVAAGLGEPR